MRTYMHADLVSLPLLMLGLIVYFNLFVAVFRFIVLFFNCLLTFGSYFCFDMPSVLQDKFQSVIIMVSLLINRSSNR